MAQAIDSIFCTVLEAGTSKCKVPIDLVADDSLPNLQREDKLSGVSSYKGTNPIVRYEGPLGLISNTIARGMRLQHRKLGGTEDTYSVHIKVYLYGLLPNCISSFISLSS